MNRMGVGHLYFDRILSPDELITMIQSVTQKDICMVAEQLFSKNPSLVTVGDITRATLQNLHRQSPVMKVYGLLCITNISNLYN